MPAMKHFQYAVGSPPTFDMTGLGRLSGLAYRQVSPEAFKFEASKIIPMLASRNIYAVFLIAMMMIEYAKHVMLELDAIGEGEIGVLDAQVVFEKPLTVDDCIRAIEQMAGGESETLLSAGAIIEKLREMEGQEAVTLDLGGSQ